MKKQIEEMYKDLCESKQERKEFCDNKECRDCEHVTLPRRINCETFYQAKLLIAKGYRKQSEGHWFIVEYEFFTCSECNYDYYNGCSSTRQAKERLTRGCYPNFCPDCGANMKGADNEKAD